MKYDSSSICIFIRLVPDVNESTEYSDKQNEKAKICGVGLVYFSRKNSTFESGLI